MCRHAHHRGNPPVHTTTSACAPGRLRRHCRHRRDGQVWVRRGLRTAAVGACLDLVYALGRFADVFLVHRVHRGCDPSTWANATRTCLTVGLTLNTIGWTAPLWGSRVRAVQAWWADYRNFRRLRPLWYALYRAHPEISLQPASRSDLLALWDLRFRLHRRVIEIRDGCLALGGQVTPGLPSAPGPEGSVEERARWEAARMAAALAGRPGHHGRSGRNETDGRDGRGGTGGGDVTDGRDGTGGRDGTDGRDGTGGWDGTDGRDGTGGAGWTTPHPRQ
ncbi:MAB_1171c family putative transporter [Streptomyces sp. NPDC002039]|uniref:MAB_1171c family putative transporter n=1 Tax=Streptomyces sp. NPDC002039 TaxID=3154660 RepID=UPI0033289567